MGGLPAGRAIAMDSSHHDFGSLYWIDAEAPTLTEGGLKDFEVIVWHGIYAPKGTPAAMVDKFGSALRTALKDPAFSTRMTDLGAEIVPDAKQTPECLRTWLQSEINKWGPVIRSAGVYAD